MGKSHAIRSLLNLAAVFVACAMLSQISAASSAKVIYSFAGDDDGEYADTDLIADHAGNLYGTTVQGGRYGSGTVFEVTPSGVHTVLYDFTGGTDGGEPYKGVTLDAAGDLYGTAVTGGTGTRCDGGCGVLYKLTNTSGSWTQSVIHQFTGGNDGSGPGSGVTFDSHGNLYGTTPTGGAKGYGVIFQMTPDQNGTWKFSVIHTFTGGVDGLGGSAGRLILDGAGNLYGTCTAGGANGFGNVYELSSRNRKWQLKTLYSFQDQPDGALPYGGLIFDKAGNLYGTTYYAGANDVGTVYELSPANGSWKETVLYSFKGEADGDSPISTLVADSAGSLYGTTSDGGAATCGCGTIFKMSRSGSGWKESTTYQFPGTPGAGFAYNGMVVDSKGNIHGATVHGGTSNDGAIYQFVP